jgi:UDP-N-acetylmuramate dehydrogenase
MNIEEAVALAPRSSLGVGGHARYFVRAESASDVTDALAWASSRGLPLRVLGGGSNLVIADEGFDGLVLSIGLRGTSFLSAGDAVELCAAAGEPWDDLVALTVKRGLAGLECLSGIPGLAGATPLQNVGAYGQEVSECVSRVRAIERATGKAREFSGSECRFGYRNSLFKAEAAEEFVIVEVTYRLKPGAPPKVAYAELARELAARGIDRPALADVRSAVLAIRRNKSMVLDPHDENCRSCGSFFVNPIVSDAEASAISARAGDTTMPRYPQADGTTKLSAAWLIERAGLGKGTRRGSVGLSTRHSLAIVCHHGAKAEDVVRFAKEVRGAVLSRFGVRLVPEPIFWGFSGDPLGE